MGKKKTTDPAQKDDAKKKDTSSDDEIIIINNKYQFRKSDKLGKGGSYQTFSHPKQLNRLRSGLQGIQNESW